MAKIGFRIESFLGMREKLINGGTQNPVDFDEKGNDFGLKGGTVDLEKVVNTVVFTVKDFLFVGGRSAAEMDDLGTD
jgi:hypothetical protein